MVLMLALGAGAADVPADVGLGLSQTPENLENPFLGPLAELSKLQ